MAKKRGTSRGETISGTGSADQLYGLGGDDLIIGKAGNDKIFGGNGFDVLRGGKGNDLIYGGNQSDTLRVKPAMTGSMAMREMMLFLADLALTASLAAHPATFLPTTPTTPTISTRAMAVTRSLLTAALHP